MLTILHLVYRSTDMMALSQLHLYLQSPPQVLGMAALPKSPSTLRVR